MHHDLLVAIDQLKEKASDIKIAVIGDLMLDRYWYGTTGNTIHPEHPALPLLEVERCAHMPGGAANVAMNVKALGAQVAVFGTIGNDGEGEELLSLLEAVGIPSSGILAHPCVCTTTKTRLMNQDGQMMRIDRDDRHGLLPPSEARMAEYISRSLDKVDAVIVSDYDNGFLSDYMLGTIFDALEGKDIPVIVDPKRTDFSAYAGAAIITPNRIEAAAALIAMGMSIPAEDRQSIEALMAAARCKTMVLKSGAEGATVYQSGLRWQENHFPAWRCENPDVAGAGDTLVAMLATALAAGVDIVTATALGNLAAGVSVSKPLTATVTLAECVESSAGISYEA